MFCQPTSVRTCVVHANVKAVGHSVLHFELFDRALVTFLLWAHFVQWSADSATVTLHVVVIVLVIVINIASIVTVFIVSVRVLVFAIIIVIIDTVNALATAAAVRIARLDSVFSSFEQVPARSPQEPSHPLNIMPRDEL